MFIKSILVLFLTYFFQVYGQHTYYKTLNNENGLITNEIYQIIQDNKGFLWIGCDAGLLRYNGYEFKHFTNLQQNSRSISGLKLDVKGNLWCNNFSGQLFRIFEDSLILVGNYTEEANKFQIAFSNQSGFWKINKDYLSFHDIWGHALKKIPLDFKKDLYGNGISMLFFDNNLWIEIPGYGLYYLDEKNNHLKLILNTSEDKNFQSQLLFTFNGNLYLIRCESSPKLNNFVYQIDIRNKKANLLFSYKNASSVRYYSYYVDRYNELWVGTSDGAIQLNRIHDIINPKKVFFKGFKISSIYQDNERNYWFSDLQNGIHLITDMKVLIQNKNFSEKFQNDIYIIKPLNDSLLITGHYNGELFFYDTKKNIHIPISEINKIKGITVKDIEPYGDRWYISRGHLMVYDPKNQETYYPKIFGNARDIIIYKDTVFSVHPEYLTRFAIKELQKNKDLNFEVFYQTGGKKVEKDPGNEMLYFALNNGLYYYQQGKMQPILLNHESVRASTLSKNQLSVWVLTHAQGILEVKNGKIIRNILNTNSLKDHDIKFICADNQWIWGLTHSEFFRIHLENENLEKYSLNIGINPADITSITEQKEELFIGTKKSLIRIPKSLNPVNSYKPFFFIEKVYYDDSSNLLPFSVLPFDFSNLKFEFLGISFRSGKDLKYQYRLLGFDSTWKTLPYNTPYVSYSSLPWGNYTFEAKAINESGIESNTQKISFSVEKPFWEQKGFYIFLLIFFTGIIILVTRYQIRRIHKRHEMEKKLIQSQLKALRAQMNPHFVYNSLISIQSLILKQDIKNSNFYLIQFSHLMRKILDSSDKEQISLQEEIEILELYLSLEKLRFGEDFVYYVHSSEEVDIDKVTIPPLLLQPFVENAIKHGLLHKEGQKFLSIQFLKEKGITICRIRDNGIGRAHAMKIKERLNQKYSSFSTRATQKRVELMNHFAHSNYKIEIIDLFENQIPSGTEVKITLHT